MSKNDLQQELQKLIDLGTAVIKIETAAVAELADRIDKNFARACMQILACKGRTVVIGMGKSGHIGNKIAATLASTGTPAFFVHPGEASHGDLGMITKDDVVIALSNSGETDEVIALLPVIKRLNVPLIALTGKPDSTLAKAATVNINVSVTQEACPLGLAPTSSTTAALAMGDALAIALLEARGFSADDFALAHPGGMLGRRLLLHVNDIMHTGADIPKVGESTLLKDTLLEMTQKGLGTTAVVDSGDHVIGIFTDGDVRRTLDNGIDIHKTRIGDLISRRFKSISKDELAVTALARMEEFKINALLVTDDQNKLIGILNMHDLLRARVV
ncbi:MAG: D-arabinose 5-phosphate isomerase [Gammaproteobacteria bacterium RIFCSPLOWO2_02_FULL_47_50]|jgi:arabinose-5-phosphate isomerase|nr:MAG: D-arabinose 5-phosphate isomerase [Gammaproteobacteria bacterium RIFCSPLOWO2_01_FULL_47_190]OGT75505.1 MAG: D-arabinose 5-phosphate isomerase [Gammaproteobacteria bacterium RIFCSPLOWO2_12_47_11]OGT80853.1 MAG: D-arabinose 5-phosphate isomerase [Gammaproteobacteria bacterium RIFCSPLOWO2_02_FULL_47_50]OGT83980.1 MAG: D-arabinose 5-phosphate isomerase [Gammaproteobacteria bacterium RIFCSPLOWO2_12_FULL_47_76]